MAGERLGRRWRRRQMARRLPSRAAEPSPGGSGARVTAVNNSTGRLVSSSFRSKRGHEAQAIGLAVVAGPLLAACGVAQERTARSVAPDTPVGLAAGSRIALPLPTLSWAETGHHELRPTHSTAPR